MPLFLLADPCLQKHLKPCHNCSICNFSPSPSPPRLFLPLLSVLSQRCFPSLSCLVTSSQAYMFAEALAEGAVKMGMQGATANKIAAQTLLGAAKMILETGEHPAVLRSAVCTPGGTTIHALHELEKGGLRATVMNAVEAATCWAQELGKR
nr:pyrroline-5-carboxylate reductase 3-like [Pogona vitticeps]